ncbi:MAG: uracil-DNA glycosylase [Actinomycetes bacterium]
MRRSDPAADAVHELAAAAPDLPALALSAIACTACPELVATRSSVVVGDTPPGARLMLVGEAPGAEEDRTGRPFVGASGQLLDQLLLEAGGSRADVAVLNTLKCRPPGNRPPKPLESARCRGWAERQLALAAPSLVVALGLSATRWFLGPTPLGPVRGRVHQVALPHGPVQVLPTYHPSAAIRFGPRGEPRRLLTEDLATALRLVAA